MNRFLIFAVPSQRAIPDAIDPAAPSLYAGAIYARDLYSAQNRVQRFADDKWFLFVRENHE